MPRCQHPSAPFRGRATAGAAPGTCAARERQRMRQRGACGRSPVTASPALLWRGQSVQAQVAPVLPPPCSSSSVPRAPRFSAAGEGALGNPTAGDAPRLGTHVSCFFFLCSYHPVFSSPAIRSKLILPSVSVITVPLPPTNTGTWQRFLGTRTVAANRGRTMPTTRHYFQETTTTIASGRLHSGQTLQLFKPSSQLQ